MGTVLGKVVSALSQIWSCINGIVEGGSAVYGWKPCVNTGKVSKVSISIEHQALLSEVSNTTDV